MASGCEAPSDEALAVCAGVLEHMAGHPEDLAGPRAKRLRTALIPLLEQRRGSVQSAEAREAARGERQRKQAANAKKQRIKSHDASLVNSRTLRSARTAALDKLVEQNAPGEMPALPMVPDGAVATEEQLRPIEPGGPPEELVRPRGCYTCKAKFFALHHFYDRLCPACAELNWVKRHATADLNGRVALVTGGRVKIGFQVVCKLLRAGATVAVTSRFPHDAAARYSALPDAEGWSHRLEIIGIDLRDMAAVERLCGQLRDKLGRLDIIINNACQTVKREPSYYEHLLPGEQTPLAQLPPAARRLVAESTYQPAMLSLEGGPSRSELAELPGQLDVNGQQVDLRRKTSWVLPLGEVETVEAAEAMAVNTLAPFIINSRLKPLMIGTPGDKWVVNVSAMEGKFYRYKTPNHPHTNMAKAALNMMTRTCAEALAAERIYMNSVDTGWINDENPAHVAARIHQEQDFQTPIDEIDAAARVLDPVWVGANGGENKFGLFLKDYAPTEW